MFGPRILGGLFVCEIFVARSWRNLETYQELAYYKANNGTPFRIIKRYEKVIPSEIKKFVLYSRQPKLQKLGDLYIRHPFEPRYAGEMIEQMKDYWRTVTGRVHNMCGRFTFIDIEDIRERFKTEQIDLKPNYNVAPTQNVPVIINNQLSMIRCYGTRGSHLMVI